MLLEVVGSAINVKRWFNYHNVDLKIPDQDIKGFTIPQAFKLYTQDNLLSISDFDGKDLPSFGGKITSINKKDVDNMMSDNPSYDENLRMDIAGVANANIVDHMDERLNPSGVVAEVFKRNPVLLVDHRYVSSASVGQVDSLTVREDGVHFDGWVGDPKKAPLTHVQKEVRSLIAQGILKSVSVGFIPKKVKSPLFNDSGEMVEPAVIEEWVMLELSLTPVPANSGSLFEMKSMAGYLNLFANYLKCDTVGGSKTFVDVNQSNSQSVKSVNNQERKNKMTEEQFKAMIEALNAIKSEMQKNLTISEAIKTAIAKSKESDKEDDEEKDDEYKKAFDGRLKAVETGLEETKSSIAKIVEMLESLTNN